MPVYISNKAASFKAQLQYAQSLDNMRSVEAQLYFYFHSFVCPSVTVFFLCFSLPACVLLSACLSFCLSVSLFPFCLSVNLSIFLSLCTLRSLSLYFPVHLSSPTRTSGYECNVSDVWRSIWVFVDKPNRRSRSNWFQNFHALSLLWELRLLYLSHLASYAGGQRRAYT